MSVSTKFKKAICCHYLILIVLVLALVFGLMHFFPLGHPFLAFYALVFGGLAIGGRKVGSLVVPLADDKDYQIITGNIDDAKRLKKHHKLWTDVPWSLFGVTGAILEILNALSSAVHQS